MESPTVQPIGIVQIPNMNALREKLGYSASTPTAHAALTGAIRAWCEEYKSPDGTPAKDLTDWKSADVQMKLTLLARDFLVKGGHGPRLWPAQNPPKIPEWPRDKERIFLHLRQLFWRHNVYESRHKSKPRDPHRVTEGNTSNDHSAGAETNKPTIYIADFVEKYKQGLVGPHCPSSPLLVHARSSLAPCFDDASHFEPKPFHHHNLALGQQHGLPGSPWDAPHSTAINRSIDLTLEDQDPGVDSAQPRGPSKPFNWTGDVSEFYGSEHGEKEHQMESTMLVVLKYDAQKYKAPMAKMIDENISIARVQPMQELPSDKVPGCDESTMLELSDTDGKDDDDEDYTPQTKSKRKRTASQKSNIRPSKSKSAKKRPYFGSTEQDLSQWPSDRTSDGRHEGMISESLLATPQPFRTQDKDGATSTKLNDTAKTGRQLWKASPAASVPGASPQSGTSSRRTASEEKPRAESSQTEQPSAVDSPTGQLPTEHTHSEQSPTEHLLRVHMAREHLLPEQPGLQNSPTENPPTANSQTEHPQTAEQQASGLLAENLSTEIPSPSRLLGAANWQHPVGQHEQAVISQDDERLPNVNHSIALPIPITPKEVRETHISSSPDPVSRSSRQIDTEGKEEVCPQPKPVVQIPEIKEPPRPGPKPGFQIRYWLVKSRTPTLDEERLVKFSIVGKSLGVLFDEVSTLTSRGDITNITLRLKTSTSHTEHLVSRDGFDDFAYLKKIFVDKMRTDKRISGNTIFEIWLEPDPVHRQDAAVDSDDDFDFDLI